MKENDSLVKVEKVVAKLSEFPKVIGTGLYYRIKYEDGSFELMNIDSENLRRFISRYFIDHERWEVTKKVWESAKDYILGSIPKKEFSNKCNRIAYDGKKLLYNIFNIEDDELKYVEVSNGEWNVKNGDTGEFFWNEFSKEQVIPSKNEADVMLLRKYLNVSDEDFILLLVYIITCMVPGKPQPILNIHGEHGSGKSTISKIIKCIVDPTTKNPASDFSDGEDGLYMQLAFFYLTVFDNIEEMPKKLNPVFCKAVTGGSTMKRKFYSQTGMISYDLKSIIIINGIISQIKKADLLNRTIFVQTSNLTTFPNERAFWNNFNKDLPYILGGIFDILAKALEIWDKVNLDISFRFMGFATLGYAIAECINEGWGEKFVQALKRNEKIQLEETGAYDPLVQVIKNCIKIHPDGISKPLADFMDKILYNPAYHSDLSNADVQALPKKPNALSRRIKPLKTLLEKMGIVAEIESIPSNDYHIISVYPVSDELEKVSRTPIMGLRKSITVECD